MIFAGLMLGFTTVTANVEYRLTVPSTISLSGPMPELKLQVLNRRKSSIPFWRSWFWNNHIVSLVDPAGNPAQLTKEGKRRLAVFPDGERFRNIFDRIKPGATYIDETADFRENFQLKSGFYRLRIEYRDKGEVIKQGRNWLVYGADIRLVSNEVPVKFVP